MAVTNLRGRDCKGYTLCKAMQSAYAQKSRLMGTYGYLKYLPSGVNFIQKVFWVETFLRSLTIQSQISGVMRTLASLNYAQFLQPISVGNHGHTINRKIALFFLGRIVFKIAHSPDIKKLSKLLKAKACVYRSKSTIHPLTRDFGGPKNEKQSIRIPMARKNGPKT